MAQNIVRLMEQNDVDRNKLSNDLNISYTTIRDWVKGITYPRIDKIEMLANYFGVSKSDLVEKQVEKSPLENQIFPKRLLSLMDSKNLSVEELSSILDVPKDTVINYTKGIGEPSFSVLTSIANYFDVTIDYLLGRTDIQGSTDFHKRIAETDEEIAEFIAKHPDMKTSALGLLNDEEALKMTKKFIELYKKEFPND